MSPTRRCVAWGHRPASRPPPTPCGRRLPARRRSPGSSSTVTPTRSSARCGGWARRRRGIARRRWTRRSTRSARGSAAARRGRVVVTGRGPGTRYHLADPRSAGRDRPSAPPPTGVTVRSHERAPRPSRDRPARLATGPDDAATEPEPSPTPSSRRHRTRAPAPAGTGCRPVGAGDQSPAARDAAADRGRPAVRQPVQRLPLRWRLRTAAVGAADRPDHVHPPLPRLRQLPPARPAARARAGRARVRRQRRADDAAADAPAAHPPRRGRGARRRPRPPRGDRHEPDPAARRPSVGGDASSSR
jgi:hypothetical protein